MTRDQVLDVLDRLAPLKRKKIDRQQVPVQFLEDRIAVVLPAERYTEQEMRHFNAQFQYLMTTRLNAHAFLDFTPDWRGLDSTLRGGFN